MRSLVAAALCAMMLLLPSFAFSSATSPSLSGQRDHCELYAAGLSEPLQKCAAVEFQATIPTTATCDASGLCTVPVAASISGTFAHSDHLWASVGVVALPEYGYRAYPCQTKASLFLGEDADASCSGSASVRARVDDRECVAVRVQGFAHEGAKTDAGWAVWPVWWTRANTDFAVCRDGAGATVVPQYGPGHKAFSFPDLPCVPVDDETPCRANATGSVTPLRCVESECYALLSATADFDNGAREPKSVEAVVESDGFWSDSTFVCNDLKLDGRRVSCQDGTVLRFRLSSGCSGEWSFSAEVRDVLGLGGAQTAPFTFCRSGSTLTVQ